MVGKLSRENVQEWLRGQRAAAQAIEAERAEFLRGLTSEESLRIYLSLPRAGEIGEWDPAEPSPVLTAMRRTLARSARLKRRRP